MKRVLYLCLAILMVCLTFNGCSRGGQTSTVSAGASRRYTSLPFATDDRTRVSMLIPVGAYSNITSYDYNDNTYTRELVDRSGVQMDFVAVPSADFGTRLNLLLSSGDYPDILNNGFGFSDMAYWANEGVIVPLDDYHYLDYPMIQRVFNEYPALNTVLRMGDGKVYALPRVDDAIWSTYQNGRGWIYMPWARDHRGMEFPKTLDELTEYLRWIRDNDVNGNGNPNDEIPLAFTDVYQSTAWFARAFMPFVWGGEGGFGLGVFSGRVTEQYRLNEYRDALRYMAGLYSEKLIKEDVYTWSGDQFRGMAINPTPLIGVFIDAYAHNIAGNTDPRWPEIFNLPSMNGPSGRHWSSNREPWGITRAMWHVTDKARDPELIIALYDFMSTQEMFLYGTNQKGRSWDDPDPGALGLNGRPALYKRLVQELQMPLNTLWYVQNAMMMYIERRMGEQAEGMEVINRWLTTGDPAIRDEVFTSPSFLLGGLIHWSLADEHNAVPGEHFIPPTVMSDDDSKRVSDIGAVLGPYLQQSIAEFVTGIRDINNDTAWNGYLADLDRLGSQERASIYQKYQR